MLNKDINRADVLFFFQIVSAVVGAIVGSLNLRKAFSQENFFRFSVKQDMKRYYYVAIALLILLTIGIIIYFRMVKHQITTADEDKKADDAIENALKPNGGKTQENTENAPTLRDYVSTFV